MINKDTTKTHLITGKAFKVRGILVIVKCDSSRRYSVYKVVGFLS